MFRINHTPYREVILLQNEDDETGITMHVQYLNEFTFNVYTKDESGFMTPVILDAECHISER